MSTLTPISMTPAPHVVYSQELSRAFRRGHPIAHPQAVEYQCGRSDAENSIRRPVEIGDVGYVQPEHGFFIRLSNVHLEPGVDGQPLREGLPDDFEVLHKDTISKVTDNTPVFVSQSVTAASVNAAAMGPFFGGSAVFSASSKRGAILATPDPIQCYNAIHIPDYMSHARTHINSWYTFYSQRHRIELEDLMLVTGVDHTTSWATAVFADTQLEAGFGLDVRFAGLDAGLQLACQYSWRSTFGALVNSGPGREGNTTAEAAITAISSDHTNAVFAHSPSEARPLNTHPDQSLFIRHIRAKRRSRWLGLKVKAAGEKDEDGENEDEDSDLGDYVVVDGSTDDDMMEVAHSPAHEEFVDCLEPALDYVLENSDADLAVAHDKDLEWLADASPRRPDIIVQDGIGTSEFFQVRYSIMLIQSYLPWFVGLFASNSWAYTGGLDIAENRRPDTLRSCSHSDPRVHRTTSSLGKRAHTEHLYGQQPSPIQATDDDDDDDDDDEACEDAPYNEDCVVHRVETFDQGPGKEPRKAFFNRKGIRLEIIKIDVEIDDRTYLQYAEPVPSDPTQWRCTCQKMENGKPARCSYKSKKHLVKRHIEATHMNIKRFRCSWCGSTFTQRSNAENCHLKTHFGLS